MPHEFFEQIKISFSGMDFTIKEEEEQMLEAVRSYAYYLPPNGEDLSFEDLVRRAMDHAPSHRPSLLREWTNFESSFRAKDVERCEDILWTLAVLINQLMARPREARPDLPGPHVLEADDSVEPREVLREPKKATARKAPKKDFDAWKATAKRAPKVSRNGKTVQAVLLVEDRFGSHPKRIQCSVDRHAWYALEEGESHTGVKTRNSLLDATVTEEDVMADMREIAKVYAMVFAKESSKLGEFAIEVSSGRSYWLNMANNEHPHCFPVKGPGVVPNLTEDEFKVVKAIKLFSAGNFKDWRTWGGFIASVKATAVGTAGCLGLAKALCLSPGLKHAIASAIEVDRQDAEEDVRKGSLLATQTERVLRGKNLNKKSDTSKNKIRLTYDDGGPG